MANRPVPHFKVDIQCEVNPWTMTDENTGEIRSGVTLMLPGGSLSIEVNEATAKKMKRGEMYRVLGDGYLAKAGVKIRATALKRVALAKLGDMAGPSLDLDIDEPDDDVDLASVELDATAPSNGR